MGDMETSLTSKTIPEWQHGYVAGRACGKTFIEVTAGLGESTGITNMQVLT